MGCKKMKKCRSGKLHDHVRFSRLALYCYDRFLLNLKANYQLRRAELGGSVEGTLRCVQLEHHVLPATETDPQMGL